MVKKAKKADKTTKTLTTVTTTTVTTVTKKPKGPKPSEVHIPTPVKTPTPKKAKKVKNPEPKEFLTKEQKDQLAQYKDNYTNLSIKELKELLLKNRQIRSGYKFELVKRCAEAKLLGGLSNCPTCMGGKLRFNIQTGEYFCRGFMDDDTFKNCNYTALTGERIPWQD